MKHPIHNRYDPAVTQTLLSFSTSITRTNSKLNKPSFNTKHYHMFFPNKIMNVWNSLSKDIVTATTVNYWYIYKYIHLTVSFNTLFIVPNSIAEAVVLCTSNVKTK